MCQRRERTLREKCRASRSTARASATSWTFADGGEPYMEPSSKCRRRGPRGDRTVAPRCGSGPTRRSSRKGSSSGRRRCSERFQMMAFLNRGLADPSSATCADLSGTRTRARPDGSNSTTRAASSTSSGTSTQAQGVAVRRGRVLRGGIDEEQEVEVAFQWNTGFNSDGLPQLRQRHQRPASGGMHETRASAVGADPRGQQAYGQDRGAPQGLRRQTSRVETTCARA